ncbi:MAG: hypothetical protein KGN76_16965 [Acidobacteriota bacterium]|nr:hypothetical protein [Acidobacteriota bacterium]
MADAHEAGPVLEERIAEWRSYVRRQQAIHTVDADELEDHLRAQMAELGKAGLDEEEAFLIAAKRIGQLDTLSREFAREYSERLWKRLVLAPTGAGLDTGTWNKEGLVAVGLAILAAIAIKLPELFGVSLVGPKTDQAFYARNFSLFVLPFLAGFFAWKRELKPADRWMLATPFVAAALLVNLYPFVTGGSTESLEAIHLPLALWLVLGFAYAGGRWRAHDQRMHYVRFSGEWFIYYALIAFGGGVLMMFTMFIFRAIGLNAQALVQQWIAPCGAVGAVIVAAWLVEAKQSIIENLAPVLTTIFTPLFTILLLGFLGTMAWTGKGIHVEREALIGFDLLLVLVVGLLLYAISARDSQAGPRFFDWLQLVLVICALVVDAFALWAIAARITDFGFSPNRVAALGENIILLVNLAWSAVLYARFLGRRAAIAPLERWQTSYLPVYFVWMWVVVAGFPLIFNFQ